MAPAISPKPINAPINVVLGININIEATNSATPVPMRPRGSIPSVSNSFTDCGCAVNLKYKVISNMAAGIILNNQVKTVFPILMQFYSSLVTPAVCYMTTKKSNLFKLLKLLLTEYIRNKIQTGFPKP